MKASPHLVPAPYTIGSFLQVFQQEAYFEPGFVSVYQFGLRGATVIFMPDHGYCRLIRRSGSGLAAGLLSWSLRIYTSIRSGSLGFWKAFH